MAVAAPISLSNAPLSSLQKRGLIALVALFLVFGIHVELRSAFRTHRRTDLGVYLRTSWAVKTGQNIYRIADEHGWHYHYPPLFAIAMTPLADPPAGADRSGTIPFAASVALWYAFSLLCLAWGIHTLATALEKRASERSGAETPRFSQAWWGLRVLPCLVCVPAIGHTLARGQVNLLLLALLCGMAAAALDRRSFHAGLWLAGAICLKVVPLFLLLYPLWRRDYRWLAGTGLGLIVGLGLIPAAVFGPARTVAYYQEYVQSLIKPGVAGGEGGEARSDELLDMKANDNQSLLNVMHNAVYRDPVARPAQASPSLRLVQWLIGGLLTLATLAAAGWRRPRTAPEEVLFMGALVIVMLLMSPMYHLHYSCIWVLLVSGLVALYSDPARAARLAGLRWLLAAVFVGGALPLFDSLRPLKEHGLAMGVAVLLWSAAVLLLFRGRQGDTRSSAPATV